MLVSDDWGRTADLDTHTFLSVKPNGRIEGQLVGTCQGIVYRFIARMRQGNKPLIDLWESEDGYVWGRDLREF